jgi:hypothetical protein
MFHLTNAAQTLLHMTILTISLVPQDIRNKTVPGKEKRSASMSKVEKAIPDKTPTLDQKRALTLLDQVFESANRFSPDDQGWRYELKMKLQAQIADAVWDYDQPRARRLFEEAVRPINRHIPKDAVVVSANTKLNLFLVGSSSREVLRLIVRRDADLAERIFGMDDNYSQVEMEISTLLAEINPQRAIQVAKANSTSTPPLRFLTMLRQKDASLADEFFIYELSVAPRNTEGLFGYLTGLFEYVFPDFGISESDFWFNPTPNTTSRINPALLLRFLDFSYYAMMQEANAAQQEAEKDKSINERIGYGYMYVRVMLLYLDKHIPEKAAAIRARWDGIMRSLPKGENEIKDFDYLMRISITKEALSEAETTKDSDIKQSLYLHAWQHALARKDFDQALSIVGKISSKETRSDLESRTRYYAAIFAIGKGDLDIAHKFGKAIADLERRAYVFSQMAQALQDKKEIGRATEIIREAVQSIGSEKSDFDKGLAMLAIAGAAARLDPSLGFEIMRSTVEIINLARLDALPNGTKLVVGWFDFNESFPLLARSDFDHALQLAQAIKAREASMLAQVAACRGLLIQP